MNHYHFISTLLLYNFTTLASPIFRFSYLSSNQLSGAIPNSIGNLVKIRTMYVSLLLSIGHFNDSFSNNFRHNSFLSPPSLQLFVFQSTEWSHPWFDRKSCQPSVPVCVILIFIFDFNNSSLIFHDFRFDFLPSFTSAVCISTNWVEPSLIRSGTLSTLRVCMYHYRFHLSYQQLIHPSFAKLTLLTFSSASSIPICWVEPSLIRSGTLSTFKTCTYYSYLHLTLTLLTSTNHVQLFEFQSSEWSHPWFDRESCLPWESVCLIIIFIVHFNNSSSHYFSLLSSQFFSFPTFSSASCIPINWVEPSLIRSGTLSDFGNCTYHE